MTKNIQIPYITRIITLFAILAGSGCSDDFLTVTPNHYVTEADFYKTEADFVQAVNAVYANLQDYVANAHFLQEGRSDNTTYDNELDQGSLGGFRQYGFLDQFKETAEAGPVADAWNQIYLAIKNCNVPLANLEGAEIDLDLAQRLSGELRFFRAYFHFIAVQYWGDVPLLLTPITTAEQAYAIRRTPVSEVYQSILEDVEFAISALPESYTGGDRGRVTRYAAKMLLAKIYMTSEDFRDYGLAQVELEDIVNSNQFDLLDNYADVFDPANKNHTESIFEVQFMDGTEGEASSFIYQFAPVGSRGTVLSGPGNGSGRNMPTLDFVNAYEASDLRMDVSVGTFDRNGLTVYYVKKYDHDVNPDFNVSPDNWPIYRYADVLLMLAEAINEQVYNTGVPFDNLNAIRDRANLPLLTTIDLPDQDAVRDALAQERRMELAFENHRWFDLVRTGTAIEVMTAYGQIEMANPTFEPPGFLPYDDESWVLTPNKLRYKIPSAELTLAPLGQNPTD